MRTGKCLWNIRYVMTPLNLPSFEYNVKNKDGKVFIFDIIRRKYIQLTPEEWVRQHFIHYMIQHLGYPKSLIKVETGLVYNQLKKRSDIIVYNRTGDPWLIVECKSPSQTINTSTVTQVSVYNVSMKASFVVMTNGIKHICYSIGSSVDEVVMMNSFPAFEEKSPS